MPDMAYGDMLLRVMRELLDMGFISDKSVTRIRLTSKDAEVSVGEYIQAIQGIPVNINVSAQAIASTSLNLSLQIQEIVKELEKKNLDPKKIEEAKKELSKFEVELKRPKPRWPQVLGYGRTNIPNIGGGVAQAPTDVVAEFNHIM
jgi:hypothetical protein